MLVHIGLLSAKSESKCNEINFLQNTKGCKKQPL